MSLSDCTVLGRLLEDPDAPAFASRLCRTP
jgi:hypothetical protein